MSNTRRGFLQTAPGLTAISLSSRAEGGEEPSRPAAPIQVPQMKFGKVEIGRLVLGSNPFFGGAHFNTNFTATMADWYTPDRVCAVMHQCNRFGINAFNYCNLGRSEQDLARFQAEGGKMRLIMQVRDQDDAGEMARKFGPLALQRRGEEVDAAYRSGKLGIVKEWCKKARDTGVMVGVGTHKPDVISQIEDEGWDVDFYSGCVYNRTRTDDEWRKMLNGELPEMPRDFYLQSDPPRMYKVMRQASKPCFAFKILAAGRIPDSAVEQAFRTAFESIKPNDGVYVGVFPRIRDEVRQDAEIVHRILIRQA
jgi:hypothetical protein